MSTPERSIPDSSPAAYDWKPYFDARRGQPPRETLVRALDAFEREDALAGKRVWRVAVDLGCGDGNDLREVLRRNGPTCWRAKGMDAAFHHDLLSSEDWERVSITVCTLEDVPKQYPGYVRYGRSNRTAKAVDLINASFSLPFCEPGAFPALWRWIVDKLMPGGRFAGQLFGVDDEWRRTGAVPAKTFHTRDEVEGLLRPFDVEHFEEVNRIGKTSVGEAKHWHVFHLVGRKRG